MCDILLIFPRPSATSPQQNPAISIFYPGEAAAKEGFIVDYWDERIDSFSDLEEKAQRTKVFAVSSLSGYMLGRAIKILKWCKKNYPDKPTILGGVHATFMPEMSLRENYIDYVVLGEGEERLPKLLRAIFRGNGFEEIDGVGWKNNGQILVTKRTKLFDLKENYVSPVSERTIKYFKIAATRNEVILPISRGCPWANLLKACTFCSVRDQYLGTYRHVSFKKWSADLETIYHWYPFNLLEMEDENSAYFVKNPEYALFLQKMGIRYHLHLRADQLQNETTVKHLAETGCHRIHVGVESGSDRIRNEIYRKGERVECFSITASLLSKFGIEGVYTYVIGAPTETRVEMMQTLELTDKLSRLHPKGKSRSTVYVLM
ncbi:MAG: cobalamin-dependent protein, partial [Minisyncoccia bacterium]